MLERYSGDVCHSTSPIPEAPLLFTPVHTLRQVLQSVLEQYGVAPEMFAKVCVIVDKVEKLPREQVEKELEALGVAAKTIDGEFVGRK